MTSRLTTYTAPWELVSAFDGLRLKAEVVPS